jgi:hypothetical protein
MLSTSPPSSHRQRRHVESLLLEVDTLPCEETSPADGAGWAGHYLLKLEGPGADSRVGYCLCVMLPCSAVFNPGKKEYELASEDAE